MRPQSPSGPYIGQQRLGAGLIQGDFGLVDSNASNPSDWIAPGYSDAASGFLGSPSIPRPPLPPKPIELTATGVPTSAISELPHPAPSPSTVTGDEPPSDPRTPLETQQVHHESPPPPPAVSPIDKAPESPVPFLPDETDEPPPPQDEIQESPAASPKPTRGMGGCPTTKALGLIEEGFTQITAIIEGLAEATGKPPSDLYRRLEKSRKGPSEGHLWNIYLHYFARHEKEEAARVGRPLESSQAYRSLCYAQYKVDHENYQELLEVYHELEMTKTEMTVGQRKREAEKYEKKLRDLVSQNPISV